MPTGLPRVAPGRAASVDAFRGITFVVMLFVNYLAGATAIPAGIHHVAADVDGMGLADVVFPAFMFAVGMSIPFAIGSRIAKGDSVLRLQGHIAYRGLSLIVMGLFMVNMESGFNEAAMGIRIELWSLAFYAAVLLVWGVFHFESTALNRLLRAAGIALIIWLAALYRSGADGSGWMTTQWWGILGCIGWAYLAASLVYQLAGGRPALLAAAIGLCVAVFASSEALGSAKVVAMHATHTSIVLAGTICALRYFDISRAAAPGQRLRQAAMLAAGLTAAGWLLHLAYPISKIGGTPPWALYCAAICTAFFSFLYWLMEMRKARRWSAAVEPAAASPLVTYLLPFVLGAAMSYLGLQWHASLLYGAGAVAFALLFSCGIVLAVALLNKVNFKLKL